MGRRVARLIRYPPLLHPFPASVWLHPQFTCSQHSPEQCDFPLLQLFRMKTFLLSIEGWKFVFHLSVVSVVGGEIQLWLRVPNSVWILSLAVEGKEQHCFTVCVRSVATKVLIYYVVGLVLSHLGWLSLETQWGFLLGFVLYMFRLSLPHLCFCSIW